jgi:type I site-specific restriction-modification system R (restriction) subunit
LTAHRGTESDFEPTVIERLEALRYRHVQGQHLDRPLDEVVLRDRLRAFLVKHHPELPTASVDEAVGQLARPEGADTLRRNMAFHIALTRGIEIRVERPDGTVEYRHVHAVDWDRPGENEFLVVNQLPIHGQNDRRPDIVVFVNGLPLVLFELKNPWDKHPTVEGALNQLGHYKYDIPQIFEFGFLKGYARYLAEALPNARRIGFTGTPISFGGADTVEVFGDLIHTYDIQQSQEDRATVPIHYEPRQVRLHLAQRDVDAALEEILQGGDVGARDRGRWAALAAAAGSRDRLDQLAKDLLAHLPRRTTTLEGKALVVCMTRENCVRLYDALKALRGCPEVRIVMTGDLARDPPEWTQAGHITTKTQREAIKKRLVDPDDPLKMVIVCDMWLTGTDIPCLHTLYVDKPMKGHTIIQAISRVNRVFRDKPHGLVVDYIGIGEELREATSTYTSGGGRGEPAPSLTEQALPAFRQALDEGGNGAGRGALRRVADRGVKAESSREEFDAA